MVTPPIFVRLIQTYVGLIFSILHVRLRYGPQEFPVRPLGVPAVPSCIQQKGSCSLLGSKCAAFDR